jgi:hypothetical protein
MACGVRPGLARRALAAACRTSQALGKTPRHGGSLARSRERVWEREGVDLTRRRGDAEEEAEKQGEGQNRRARSQRRSRVLRCEAHATLEGWRERHDEESTSCWRKRAGGQFGAFPRESVGEGGCRFDAETRRRGGRGEEAGGRSKPESAEPAEISRAALRGARYAGRLARTP